MLYSPSLAANYNGLILMRNLLTVLNLSMLVILAWAPDPDIRWWFVLIGMATALLLGIGAKRERQALGDQAIDSFLDQAAGFRGIRTDDQSHQPTYPQSYHDAED